MANGFDLDLAGFERTIRTFNQLEDKVAKPALRKAMRAGAAVFRKAARRAGPKRSASDTPLLRRVNRAGRLRAPGFLRRNITTSQARRGRLFYRIGPRQDAWYGGVVEARRAWLEPSFRTSVRLAEATTARRLDTEVAKAVRVNVRG